MMARSLLSPHSHSYLLVLLLPFTTSSAEAAFSLSRSKSGTYMPMTRKPRCFRNGFLPGSQPPATQTTATKNLVGRQRTNNLNLRGSLSLSMRSSFGAPAEYTGNVPDGPETTSRQALEAIKRGIADGQMFQRIELMLPLIGATDLDDWPGGIRQQFKAASPMCESILKGLRAHLRFAGGFSPKILDEGDATVAWESEMVTAILFPTAESIDYISKATTAKGDDHVVILINPQWNKGGSNFISDFGWGASKAKAEKLIDSFEYIYSFEQRKQGGANIKFLKAYPEKWNILATEDDQRFEVIGITDKRPEYKEVEQMLKASYPDENIFSRFQKEFGLTNDK